MIVFITGGSGSGKSAYAEELATTYGQAGGLYYLATMMAGDEEAKAKVHRHRQLRAGKGFQTIEQPYDIGKSVGNMEETATVLLECMSNLVANEMFSGNKNQTAEEYMEEYIMDGIKKVADKVRNLIIVSNNVFEDGVCYDTFTMEYIRVLSRVNQRIADMASQVIEVVAGIPVIVRNGA